MLSFLAVPPVWTEPCEIELAEPGADVFFGASRAERAEALIVVRAGGKLGFWVYVQVEAFGAIRAVEVAGVEIAFWHATSVSAVMILLDSMCTCTNRPCNGG